MNEIKPNSYRYKQAQNEAAKNEEKKVEKVVTGSVKTKKKSEVKKFADIFIAEDINSVKHYIWVDILVPTIQKTISEVVKNSIDIILFGKTTPTRNGIAAGKVNYSGYSSNSNTYNPNRSRYKNTYDYDEIIFDSKGDAELVLTQMDEIIDRYGMVSVLDLYDLAGVTGYNHTSGKYGWTDISRAEAVRLRTGEYVINFPKALPLE